MGDLSGLVTQTRWLFSQYYFKKKPLVVITRLLYWQIYCSLIKRPKVVHLGSDRTRICLPPQIRGTAKIIYSLREMVDIDEVVYIKKFLKPGYTFVDVGANLGYYTLIGSNIVGELGHVLSFEPTHETMQYLKNTIECNDITNVQLFPLALSNQTSEMLLWHHPDSSRNSLGEIKSGTNEMVRVDTLDNFINTLKISRVDLIKIDVEGFEGKVIQGSITTLRKFKPVILFEFNPQAISLAGLERNLVFDCLLEAGYKIYNQDAQQIGMRGYETMRFSNCIAIHQDKEHLI